MQRSLLAEITPAPSALVPWRENERALPTSFLRSALFRIAPRGALRAEYKDALVAAADNVELLFTGTELRSDDEEVFAHLLHMARTLRPDARGAVQLRFTGYEMLLELGKEPSGFYYKSLADSIDRLQKSTVRFTKTIRGRKRWFQGQLIQDIQGVAPVDESYAAASSEWIVTISREVVRMFTDALLIDQDKRRAFKSDLTRWLQGYLAAYFIQPSRIDRLRLSETELYELSGSKAGRMSTFRSSLRAAMQELQDGKMISSFAIQRGSVLIGLAAGVELRKLSRSAVQQITTEDLPLEGLRLIPDDD